MPLTGEPSIDAGTLEERASILIVDDLPEKLLVFTTILEDLGHDLVCARSGADALREILKTEFAAILLDVNMPDIDGFETASLIRQYKRSANTPILFVTSYADEMQTIRGYSLGAVDYILSPVVPVILRSKVKVFVDLHLTQRRLRRHAQEQATLASTEAARRVAEENTQRSNFLSHASQVLGASLDTAVASRQLLEMLVPTFARQATLALCDADGAVEHVFDCDIDAAGRRRLATRRPADLAAEEARRLAALVEGRSSVRALPGDPLGLRLLAADRAVGGLTVRLADGADEALVRELAERSAVALENARLFRSLQVEIEERRSIEGRLQRSNRRKDEFLAMLSHELRNPLAPIRTALEVIRRIAPSDQKLDWALDVTGRQVGQLTRLVEDLLDVARISQGKIALQVDAIDLRTVVEHAIETVQPYVQSRHHRLSVDLPDAPVMTRGDFARLCQAVANLLHNAAKYSDDGGRIEVTLATADGEAVIVVRDDGIGIDADLLPNVFELFEQGHRSLDRSQGGLGVGLTLVQRLVGMHHGTVEARSDGTGLGSEFRIRLPCLSEVASPTTAAAPAAADGAPAACRILVVDDNHDAAESTAVFLRLAGHEVKAVASGHEALACAPVYAPEVVLLDIGLPDMDGYAVAARLRDMAETAGVCLVALTGYGQPADREKARQAGFDHHLTKPADPDELLASIDVWVGAARAAALRRGTSVA